jgi:hypothetical protein
VLCFIVIVFIAFCQYDAVRTGINAQGYIFSTGLATLNILGTVYIIFIGAFAFFNDWHWNTYQHQFINISNRKKICSLKLLIILMSSLFILILVVIFTCGIHFMNTGSINGILPDKFALQLLYTLLSLVFWGELAFTLTALTRNIVIGVLIPFVVNNFEILLYQYIGQKFSRFLPSYNLKSLLSYSFDNLKSGSMIVFPDIGYGFGIFNHIYLFVLLTFFILVNIYIFTKMEIPS